MRTKGFRKLYAIQDVSTGLYFYGFYETNWTDKLAQAKKFESNKFAVLEYIQGNLEPGLYSIVPIYEVY